MAKKPTPKQIMKAIAASDFGQIKAYQEAGADFSWHNEDGGYLHQAAWSATYAAPIEEHLETMNLLIKGGADVNLPGEYGRTPVHMVRLVETLRLLLDNGADPARECGSGRSALFYIAMEEFGSALGAIERGEQVTLPMLGLLKERGTDLGADIRDSDGESVLQYAARASHGDDAHDAKVRSAMIELGLRG